MSAKKLKKSKNRHFWSPCLQFCMPPLGQQPAQLENRQHGRLIKRGSARAVFAKYPGFLALFTSFWPLALTLALDTLRDKTKTAEIAHHFAELSSGSESWRESPASECKGEQKWISDLLSNGIWEKVVVGGFGTSDPFFLSIWRRFQILDGALSFWELKPCPHLSLIP